MKEEIKYYPPPNETAAKIWPTKEEQQKPCHVCGQLPVMGLSADGGTISISHCMCPTLNNTRRWHKLEPCAVCGMDEFGMGCSSKESWWFCRECSATRFRHNL